MWFSFKLSCNLLLVFVLCYLVLESMASSCEARFLKRPHNSSISAVLVFGDSTVDPGNNNYVNTPFKSNFPPYGYNFVNGIPTGRFTDGMLVTDFIATYMGIKDYVPPYLDPTLSLDELKTGVSFASAGSGFDPLTAQLSGVIPVQKQLDYFKEYRTKLEVAIGKRRTKVLISKAVFLISAGTNDIVINYLGTPVRRETYGITTYMQFLLQNVQQLVQGLSKEGARLIAVVGMPPIGCLPIVITFTTTYSSHRPCSGSISSIALDYNQKLQHILMKEMKNSNSIIVYADIYKSLNYMIQRPSQFGFENVNSGCCGSGLVETTLMCNPKSVVCTNASEYVFFDSVHPTEAAYNYLFNALRPTIDHVIKIFT